LTSASIDQVFST
jgi:hypothetical protein